MLRYLLPAVALLALVACAPAAPNEHEDHGSTTSQIVSDHRLRGLDGVDGGTRAGQSRRPVPPPDTAAAPDPVPASEPAPEPEPDDCVTKGLPPEGRYCGRSAGTEQILYRCENNGWIEVTHCAWGCAVNADFGKDGCN